MAAMTGLAGVGLALFLAGPAASATPLAAVTALQPTHALFADRITAVATIAVDRATLDPGRVHAVAAFEPLDVVAGPAVERKDIGGRTMLRFRWQVACLSEGCVPSKTGRRVVLPPLRVTATRRDGEPVGSAARWPRLTITGRISAKQAAAATPPFRLETQLPSPTYRAGPGTLQSLLEALAALLLAILLLLTAREILVRRRRRGAEYLASLSPLARALLLAREAEHRDPADRRKALGLLARVLGSSEGLGRTASELAWSPPEPLPGQIESVVGEVERRTEP